MSGMLKEGWRGKHFFLLRWVRSEGHDADGFAFTNTNFLRATICWVTTWFGMVGGKGRCMGLGEVVDGE